MPFRETVGVFSENHTKPTNKPYAKGSVTNFTKGRSYVTGVNTLLKESKQILYDNEFGCSFRAISSLTALQMCFIHQAYVIRGTERD
jgi:hypothetical protein